jgi:hypothetical protein
MDHLATAEPPDVVVPSAQPSPGLIVEVGPSPDVSVIRDGFEPDGTALDASPSPGVEPEETTTPDLTPAPVRTPTPMRDPDESPAP